MNAFGFGIPPTDAVMPHVDDYLMNYLAKIARASPHFFFKRGASGRERDIYDRLSTSPEKVGTIGFV